MFVRLSQKDRLLTAKPVRLGISVAAEILAGVLGGVLCLCLAGCGGEPVPAHPEISVNRPSSDTWRSPLYDTGWSATPVLSFETDKLIQDFSYAGYALGEKPIPAWKEAEVLNVTDYGADPEGRRDSTAAIQKALDAATARKQPTVVYLPTGTYLVRPPEGAGCALRIRGSNLVLRGDGPERTRLLNTATYMRLKQIILVQPQPQPNWRKEEAPVTAITRDLTGPTVNIPVQSTKGFRAGDTVIIRIDPTPEWALEHREPGWVGHEDQLGGICYLRKIQSVDAGKKELTIDTPTRYSLKMRDHARVYRKSGLLHNVGLEDFAIGNVEHPGKDGWDRFAFNGDKSASVQPGGYDVHFSFAITLFGVVDGWVRNVDSFQPESNRTGCNLLSNGIRLKQCRGITVEDCLMQKNQYGGGGGNGYMYRLDDCNECLLQNCTAQYSRHGFSMSGMGSSGNVYYRCTDRDTARQTGGTGDEKAGGAGSDSHMWFAHSNLYDNCVGWNSWFEARDRYYPNLSDPNQGTTSAHTVFWNTEGGGDESSWAVWSQQGRYGYVIGTRGSVTAVKTDGLYPDRDNVSLPLDHVEGVGRGDSLEPASLFQDQRRKRLHLNTPE
jgi:ribosomal protein L21E